MFIRTLSPASLSFVVLLGFLSALPPLGIDMGLPGLANLESDMKISATQATYTLSLFLLGFALGPVVFGTLSDRYGRKIILLFGLGLFSASAFGCAFASTIHELLICRIIQGIGAGAAAALPSAIVRDVYQGTKAIRNQSYVAMINAIIPLAAPLMGSTVLLFGDWRTIYEVNAGVGALFFIVTLVGFAETAPLRQNLPQTSLLVSTFKAYQQIFINRQYVFATALLSATFGTMFSYISSSSAVFMSQLGATSTLYGFLFALTALGEMAGAACNGRFSPILGGSMMLNIAVIGGGIVSFVLMICAYSGCHFIWIFALLIILNNISAGIIMPNTTHLALQELGHVAGSAAALQRSLQMIAGAFGSSVVAMLGGSPIQRMASSMLIFAILSLLLLLLMRMDHHAETVTDLKN